MPLCIENIRSAYEVGKQLDSMKKNLADVTKFVMQETYRDEFYSRCTQAVVVKTTGLVTGTAIADVSGSGSPAVVTNEFLQDYYDRLIFNSAGNSNLLMREDGAAVFPFITSMQTSRVLKIASGYRDDYRWSPERNSELFKVYSALGAVSKPVFGMQHIIDTTPARWEWSGSAWTTTQGRRAPASSFTGWRPRRRPPATWSCGSSIASACPWTASWPCLSSWPSPPTPAGSASRTRAAAP